MASRGVITRRVQPLEAMRCMRALVADPDDTVQVFRIIRALSGGSFERLYQRVMRSPSGRRVLEGKSDLLSVLTDREGLRRLGEGSLGREYLGFVERERISAEGLVEASTEGADDSVFLDDRARVLSRRLRDSHDLWHVVTGYQRDLFGEAALLAFTFAQTRNPGVGFIVMIAMLRQWRDGHRDAFQLTWEAAKKGRRAAFFAAADWEALLAQPLDQVRLSLGIVALPSYTPLFSAEATAAR